MNPDNQSGAEPQLPQENVPQSHYAIPKWLVHGLGILIILGLIGGAYYLGTQKNLTATSTPNQQTTPVPTTASTTTDTTKALPLQTYTSPLGYSLEYPPTWTLSTDSKVVDPQGMLHPGAIAIVDPQGDKLVFDYGFQPLGVPPHVFKTVKTTIDGQAMVKAYDDGCNFNSDGTTTATAACKNTQTAFYQITYAPPDVLSSDPTTVDSTPGTNDYLWATGSQSISLGINNLHGKPSYLTFVLNKPLALNAPAFQTTDSTLDTIIASLHFTR